MNTSRISSSNWIKCESCELQFPKKKPTTGVVTNQFPEIPHARGGILSRSQVRLARKVIGDRGLIDFGCGNGAFLRNFVYKNPRTTSALGIELDADSCQVARTSGLHIEDQLPSNPTYTLTTMWHSAEHLEIGVLREILQSLNHPTNLVLISVPNGNSSAWQTYRECFAFFDNEAHIVQFTPNSLDLLLSQTNWTVERRFHTPIYGMFSALQTALNRRQPHNFLYRQIKRNKLKVSMRIIIRSICSLFLEIPTLTYLTLAEFSLKRASTLTILIKPRVAQ